MSSQSQFCWSHVGLSDSEEEDRAGCQTLQLGQPPATDELPDLALVVPSASSSCQTLHLGLPPATEEPPDILLGLLSSGQPPGSVGQQPPENLGQPPGSLGQPPENLGQPPGSLGRPLPDLALGPAAGQLGPTAGELGPAAAGQIGPATGELGPAAGELGPAASLRTLGPAAGQLEPAVPIYSDWVPRRPLANALFGSGSPLQNVVLPLLSSSLSLPSTAPLPTVSSNDPLGLFLGSGDDNDQWHDGMHMHSTSAYQVAHDWEMRHNAQQRAAARRNAARRDRSRSPGRDPPFVFNSAAALPDYLSSTAAFGAAMRSLVTARRPDSWPLVDLTGGQSTREDALCICSRRVRAEENRFYIGITENPSRRFEEHLAVQGSWTRMVILCKAHSSNDTAYLERGLINQHRDNIRCINIGRGGECASGGSPHYLYLLIGHNSLLRRSR